MPELPEVETVANALRPHLLGRTVSTVETFTPMLRTPLTVAESADLPGATVEGIRRRAKYILVDFDRPIQLLVHLGMTGSCRIVPTGDEREKHDHVSIGLDNETTWRFCDPRRFGRFEIHPAGPSAPIPPGLADLGPEPFDDAFSAVYMQRAAAGRKAPVKAFLMDNRRVVGVGNIYASEALFRAGISPHRAAGAISLKRWKKLVAAVREILQAAIEAGGTTIADFQGVDGSEGLFERYLAVYGRTGETCQTCSRSNVKQTKIAGRSTFHCPTCQR